MVSYHALVKCLIWLQYVYIIRVFCPSNILPSGEHFFKTFFHFLWKKKMDAAWKSWITLEVSMAMAVQLCMALTPVKLGWIWDQPWIIMGNCIGFSVYQTTDSPAMGSSKVERTLIYTGCLIWYINTTNISFLPGYLSTKIMISNYQIA